MAILFDTVFGGTVIGSFHPQGRSISTVLLSVLVLGSILGLGSVSGCYRGGERDKNPPPGLPGGLCLAPNGVCQRGICNRSENYCYEAMDPCLGFFCGGEGRGICTPDAQGLPNCLCDPGYSNDLYPLYCCPDPSIGFDPLCEMEPADNEPPAGRDSGSVESSGTG
ncbi:MAG: hypothetical protein AAGF11_05040 [Myxococcota bacterium]